MGKFFSHGRIAIAALIILALYGWEAHARHRVEPIPLNRGDQAAYLAYAQRMHDTHYSVAGDRNRMPVYPFLLSLIYRPGMSNAEFLARAQSFNINLSIFLLAVLFLVLRRFFSSLYSLALLMVTAFGVFVYRVGEVEVEPLYYFLSFCAFVLLLQMLIRPRWWLGLLAGATTALAYLTKASMLATIPIWSVAFVGEIFSRFRARESEGFRRLGYLLLVLATFGVIVFPYERTSKQLYGHYFFNVNSAYYMWCDSWPQAVAFTKAYRENPDFPPDQKPSPVKYWREHSAGQIAKRLLQGLTTFATRGAKLVGYYKFALVLTLIAAVLSARNWPLVRRLMRERVFATIFCFLFFLSYLLLYAWYDTVVTDSRFILTLFLPFIFVVSRFILGLTDGPAFTMPGRRLGGGKALAIGLICLASIDIGYNALRIARLIN